MRLISTTLELIYYERGDLQPYFALIATLSNKNLRSRMNNERGGIETLRVANIFNIPDQVKRNNSARVYRK